MLMNRKPRKHARSLGRRDVCKEVTPTREVKNDSSNIVSSNAYAISDVKVTV
jgi:hypothetical protein